MKKIFIYLLFSLVFLDCKVSSKVELKDDSSGIITIVVNVNKEFEKIRKELLNTLGGEGLAKKPLFPVDEIKKAIKGTEDKLTKAVNIRFLDIKTKGNLLIMILQFDNLVENLKEYLEKTKLPMLKAKLENGNNILEIDINLKNVTEGIDNNKEYINDTLAALLPSESVPMTSKDYRDVLIYFLSDFTSEASKFIDASDVVFRVKTSRPIKSQFGFKKIDSNTVEFSTNMVKGMSLEKPIKLKLVY